MRRVMLLSAVLLTLPLGLAACSSGNSEPAYQYGTAGGTTVPPTQSPGNPNTTLQQQENSGYYAQPGAPDRAPTSVPQ
jgi:hypothetical protein